jgi:hypothetical protein
MLFCRVKSCYAVLLSCPTTYAITALKWVTYHFSLLLAVTLTSLDQRHGVPFIIAVTGLVFCCHKSAIQYLRHLVHSLSLQRPGFSVRAVHVGFMLGRMALGESFPRVGTFSLATVIDPVLCNHPFFICHLSHIIVAVDSFVYETLNTVPLNHSVLNLLWC